MTTVARNRGEGPEHRQLDARAKRAWATYRESLRDLQGRDYEDAEDRSWERLQRKLKQVDDERAALGVTTNVTGPQRRRTDTAG